MPDSGPPGGHLSRARELRAQLDASRRDLERMSAHLTRVQAQVERLRSKPAPPVPAPPEPAASPKPPEAGRTSRFSRRERLRKVRDAVQRQLG